jgi:hypothetical protein
LTGKGSSVSQRLATRSGTADFAKSKLEKKGKISDAFYLQFAYSQISAAKTGNIFRFQG